MDDENNQPESLPLRPPRLAPRNAAIDKNRIVVITWQYEQALHTDIAAYPADVKATPLADLKAHYETRDIATVGMVSLHDGQIVTHAGRMFRISVQEVEELFENNSGQWVIQKKD